MSHVPEDRRAAKPRGYAEMGVWFWKRRQEVTAAAPILPSDQLTGVSGCEEVPVGPIASCEGQETRKDTADRISHI